MVNTKRFQGLRYLKNIGLPTPSFIKISHLQDLKQSIFKKKAPYGWTIRTCRKDGTNEINLFYKNNLSQEDTKKILNNRIMKYKDEFYIIYPSWEFYLSINVLKTNSEYIIEGQFGTQKNISAGKENPEFRILINSFTHQITESPENLLLEKNRKIILESILLLKKRILCNTFYVEAAITTSNNIIFYEFWDLENLVDSYK